MQSVKRFIHKLLIETVTYSVYVTLAYILFTSILMFLFIFESLVPDKTKETLEAFVWLGFMYSAFIGFVLILSFSPITNYVRKRVGG